MNNENVMNDIEAILNDLYPKQTYEGSFITANNTIEGLRGKAVTDEETEITVCNKNILNITKNIGYTDIDPFIYSQISNSECSIIGTGNTSSKSIWFSHKYKYPVKIPAGTTITFSAKIFDVDTNEELDITNMNVQISLYFYDSDNRMILTSLSNTKGSIETKTLTKNVLLNDFTIEKLTDETYNIRVQVQLEIGDTATEYIENQLQTFTGKEFDFKTYDEITHIYNLEDINMSAEIREKEE